MTISDTHADSALTNGLNERQLAAVTAEPGNQLVIAGAGSGKTRVLVHRLAYLIQHYGYSPYELMAVTFTNKAARVMAGRVAELLGIETRHLWIGTFHGLANRMLRRDYDLARLPRDFQILPSDDQRRVVRELMKSQHMDVKQNTPIELANWINRVKDEGKRPEHLQLGRSPEMRRRIDFYRIYDEFCQKNGLVDFGEILLRCHEMLLEHDDLLRDYHDRFSGLLVDEFQDTNVIQYHWIRLLTSKDAHVMVVGDDDQSIYGWRGAVVQNIRNFSQDFPNTNVVRLEQNYRSTANILNAANKVIENNDDRLGKTLWTNAADGEPIHVFPCDYGEDEANYVVDRLQDWVREDSTRTYENVAVLYRSHFQSLALEIALQGEAIPYTIRGGARFYDRAEVRDALGYMQLANNRDLDVAFDRVLNIRPRGIGNASQERIREFAVRQGLSLWDASHEGIKQRAFPDRLAARLAEFLEEISRVSSRCEDKHLVEIADVCVYESGLMDYHMESERNEQLRETRRENLQEFIRSCGVFEEKFLREDLGEGEKTVLQSFLDTVTLDAGDVEEDLGPAVSLMTLHAAKGLEFPLVFIVGMMEGRFPHHLNLDDPVRLYEERRLAYVGFTRAMEQLHLTYAKRDRGFSDRADTSRVSRFVKEIPAEFLHYAQHRRVLDRRRFRRYVQGSLNIQ
ncbi:MAG: UvrD-helicase domain-containing protein [Gammaproteobacteria bacterium]|nr:UvrD-helicase domain-containing protein [Gammaproteobacteria bacterium]